ncbi:ComEA family DNA-binding protein [Aurantivibrio plasticivorans]
MKNLVSLLLVSVLVLSGGLAFAADKSDAKHTKSSLVVERVNINKADAATLAANLIRVGDSRAKAIVEYRKQHGKFTSKEQLLEVKGIGESTLKQNLDRIVL